MIKRKDSTAVPVGGVIIGGGSPVSLQSMTNTKTVDLDATLQQIINLAEAGCDLVRVAVPDEKSAAAFKTLVQKSPVPLIADIHFNARLALLSLEYGAAKIRINPGNIGGKENLLEVAAAAAQNGAAIRVGVNAGSLEKGLLHKHRGPTPEAMVESARGYIRILESVNFDRVVVSLKASNVVTTIQAYRIFSETAPYPLHLGITEAGPTGPGIVKAAVGIGTLLAEGIGDTVRVSLTADPLEEVKVGRLILQSLNLRIYGPELISCPACARCEVDLVKLTGQVEDLLKEVRKPLKVAVMGCAVNGPGEAREADIGVCAGQKKGIIFSKGKVIKTVRQDEILNALKEEINSRLDDST